MIRTLRALGVAVATCGAVLVAAPPASADITCTLSSNAHQFDGVDRLGGRNYEFTLHAGRGFRWYQVSYVDGYGRKWLHGNGAEHPNNSGWILSSHFPCD